MLINQHLETCPGCGEAKVQENKQTGIKERCPVCGGSGTIVQNNLIGTGKAPEWVQRK